MSKLIKLGLINAIFVKNHFTERMSCLLTLRGTTPMKKIRLCLRMAEMGQPRDRGFS